MERKRLQVKSVFHPMSLNYLYPRSKNNSSKSLIDLMMIHRYTEFSFSYLYQIILMNKRLSKQSLQKKMSMVFIRSISVVRSEERRVGKECRCQWSTKQCRHKDRSE